MTYNPRDRFFKEAKKENYLARSVYKLKEIDQRFKVLRKGMRVLDLGCSPGSWSQYASERVQDSGRVIGLDLTEMRLTLPNADFFCCDIGAVLRGLDGEPLEASEAEAQRASTAIQALGCFDLVMSDMAPKTTGIKSVDQDRSMGLCEMALDCAIRMGDQNSNFICKFFHSGDFAQLRKAIQSAYKRVEIVKPESTRTISKEIFFVGIGLKSKRNASV